MPCFRLLMASLAASNVTSTVFSVYTEYSMPTVQDLLVDLYGDDLAGDAGVVDACVGDDGFHAFDLAGVEAALGIEVPCCIFDFVHVVGAERDGFGAALDGEREDGGVGALNVVQDALRSVVRSGGRG